MNADIAHSRAPRPERAQPADAPRPFTIRLSATPRGARLARRLAAEQLHGWGWSYDTEANRTAALLVAELAANAVRHGRVSGRDFHLRLSLHPQGPALRIEVTDARADRFPPRPGALAPPSADVDSGRGLLLVEALSTHWGTATHAPYTKTVWCEVVLG
ncbi:anti-sigma regulatory factor (Ser/Thr protein kinase) [Streptomyces sp. BK208]|uniref:ATP-binding protein n=1 Tax=Streptomyces sp. BK208 TaxID=2512150 RepID=UPI0010612E45|nr:ATP-binding protein [Streptomyces sp. BK208]TDT40039.1 anti-sigma regulatory factor (Ser/Thr protein kinase) [Streptomyces sp. BK208]